MQYVGGKEKSGGHKIAALIRSVACGGPVTEPFCGGLSVTYRLQGLEVYASDAVDSLIVLYKAVTSGWDPPTEVTREVWDKYKACQPPFDPMTAFVGFGCSRSGAWFSSYIDKYKYTDRVVSAAEAARTSLKRKLSKCTNVNFACHSYDEAQLRGVVYCDPPYANTVSYAAAPQWDPIAFWDWARDASSEHVVLVSELVAPDDFVPVLSMSIQSRIATQTGKRRTEYVFVHTSRRDEVRR